uniref:NADH-ubiquinone oxidoreductase chain 3 n=1 Tax=Platypus contaminatus TaxID=2066526 RepID=A0A6C0RUK7_9CUCU|nr:NADH dehydrogenase subunit 3 [Platypus contaminatus]QIA44534.1 NADH dehydrogenase subunit 3 [Platypus contaminatus]
MFLMMSISSIIIVIIMALISILNITAKKKMTDREKSSPFECGFDPKASSRMPFSIHFFLIAIIFVIFDVELVLLLPSINSIKTIGPSNLSIMLTFFVLILLLGVYHEWNQGALNWKY